MLVFLLYFTQYITYCFRMCVLMKRDMYIRLFLLCKMQVFMSRSDETSDEDCLIIQEESHTIDLLSILIDKYEN